jgi:hypothetical protein
LACPSTVNTCSLCSTFLQDVISCLFDNGYSHWDEMVSHWLIYISLMANEGKYCFMYLSAI